VAPVLVCPECSTKHPLGNIGERGAFPCEGCGRTLKVPAAAMSAVAAGAGAPTTATPPAPAPAPAPRRPVPEPESATGAMPAAEVPPPMPAAADAQPARSPVPPAWIRFLLWLVAVPLAFILVFGFARTAGMLTTNQISDVALAEGWGRFWPVARLIPFVALVTAGIVQGGAYLIAELRRRRWAEKGKGPKAAAPHTNGAGAGQPAPRRPRGQSTRTRA
jgi:hypothetical protein